MLAFDYLVAPPSEPVVFKSACQACSAILTIKDDAARGRKARCPKCSATTRLKPLVRPVSAPRPAPVAPGPSPLPLDGDDDLDDLLSPDAKPLPPDVDFPQLEDDVDEPVSPPPRSAPVQAPDIPSFVPAPPPRRTATEEWPPVGLSHRLRLAATSWGVLARLCVLGALIVAGFGVIVLGIAVRDNRGSEATAAALVFFLPVVVGQLFAALPFWTISLVLRWLAEPRQR